MSFRPRRALVGLVAAAAALAALPASALAAGETLSVTPSGTQANSNPSITATLGFAAGDTPKTVVTSLAPGVLSNLNANLACLASQQLTAACQIGNATVHTTVGDLTGNLYLVPAQGSDAVGIEFVPAAGPLGNQYMGVSLNPGTPGSLNLTTTFPNPGAVHVTGFTATFNPTLNGQPFTRLPSSCSTATSTMTATYYGSTPSGSASGSFTPTGCSSLPYAPKLTASITKDKSGNGATLVFGVTQAANEAASKSIVLKLPKGLAPNALAVGACLTGTGPGCTVGTATATSPLVPSPALDKGTVTLAGTLAAPTLTIAFPAPFAITFTGKIDLAASSVTFASLPDVPLTSLTQTITGPNGQKAFTTDCKPANVAGTFTGQNGLVKSINTPVTFAGCASKPIASGSTSGLASGHPRLKFKVTHGKGAPNVAAVAIGVPAGLKFSRSAIVSHKTCTTKDKKRKCTTTTLIKGLGISGATPKSVAIKAGRLVITLKKPAASVTITAAGPLVSETKALQTNVRKRKVKSLKFSLKITDAKKAATTVSLTLRAH